MRRSMLLVGAVVVAVALAVSGATGSAASGRGRWAIRDLGTRGGKFSIAYAINERGQVVGTSRTSSGEQHVFLWQGGNMSDLGRYIGMGSIRVNDQGQVV
jgi:probable HAF family extracellular repeat protein